MTMIIVSGGIDLSVGSVVALTTVVDRAAAAARAGRRWPPRSPASPRPRLCGLINGAPDHRPARRPLHRHARHDDPRARRGEGPGRRAPHRSAADLAQRPAAHARSGRARPCCRAGVWLVLVARAARRGRASLHALRPARVRDRIERAHRAAVRRGRARGPRSPSTRIGALSPASPACCSSRACRSAIRPWPTAWSSTSSPR